MRKKMKKILMTGLILFFILVFAIVLLFRFIPIPTTPYMISETSNHGAISYSWVNLKDISASVPLSIVAAEDVNFCNHWGFDLAAIRSAIEQGSKRGASTLSQQVVKKLISLARKKLDQKSI